MPSNTTRIAKNTLMLYFRQILIMLVSLYTVRVVLETLGAEDYGIYNVVAGVVTMFGFLSNSMAMATQRYLSFELGRKDFEQLKKVFSVSLTIYVLIAIVVLVLAETVGLWFVSNKLVIPIERKSAALWVYQFAILSFLFTILTAPYMATIIAHEDMNIYAYVSIVDAVLRLGIVFILQFIAWDKLQLYGILIGFVSFINTFIYMIICKFKYQECKFNIHLDKDLFGEIIGYIGWNLFGSFVGIFKNQLVNILLNQFFNPLVIASRSIAASITSAAASFSYNFSTAIRPQIIKNYATGKNIEMLSLVFRGAKATYFLMYIFVLPITLEMSLLINLWVNNQPHYTILFARLALIDMLIDTISYPLITVAQATGRIRLYQSVVGGILLLNLPLSWLALSFGMPAYSVMVIAICISLMAFLVRLLIVQRLVNYSIIHFLREVILPICMVTTLSAIIPIIIYHRLDQSFLRLGLSLFVSVISVCTCIYFIGLSTVERQMIKKIIKNRLHVLV
jgi:O-antigen/teichoic acid export membrane protein